MAAKSKLGKAGKGGSSGGNWVTINGARVLIGADGQPKGKVGKKIAASKAKKSGGGSSSKKSSASKGSSASKAKAPAKAKKVAKKAPAKKQSKAAEKKFRENVTAQRKAEQKAEVKKYGKKTVAREQKALEKGRNPEKGSNKKSRGGGTAAPKGTKNYRAEYEARLKATRAESDKKIKAQAAKEDRSMKSGPKAAYASRKKAGGDAHVSEVYARKAAASAAGYQKAKKAGASEADAKKAGRSAGESYERRAALHRENTGRREMRSGQNRDPRKTLDKSAASGKSKTQAALDKARKRVDDLERSANKNVGGKTKGGKDRYHELEKATRAEWAATDRHIRAQATPKAAFNTALRETGSREEAIRAAAHRHAKNKGMTSSQASRYANKKQQAYESQSSRLGTIHRTKSKKKNESAHHGGLAHGPAHRPAGPGANGVMGLVHSPEPRTPLMQNISGVPMTAGRSAAVGSLTQGTLARYGGKKR